MREYVALINKTNNDSTFDEESSSCDVKSERGGFHIILDSNDGENVLLSSEAQVGNQLQIIEEMDEWTP